MDHDPARRIFHLAAVVSGDAEADFDKGYRVNLDGARQLFEAIRQEGTRAPYHPRAVFTSSIAVFGAPFPDVIGDEFFTTPLTQLRNAGSNGRAPPGRLFHAADFSMEWESVFPPSVFGQES
jgi:Nucleoside-diphosphate-sugar epimerases